ncbi:MAG: alpha-glucan family phosphorylase [Acidobacteria bacterium]|nr:alpha-glucan family phosphorylase [Acidobacteriota bacterium]
MHKIQSAQADVAYFSMEIAVEPAIPTYSGGLGILAGDFLRSAADQEISMVGVTLLHRRGYFRQRLDDDGRQIEEPENWNVLAHLEDTHQYAHVDIRGHPVTLAAWKYEIESRNHFKVPVYFLDTLLPHNEPWTQTLTDNLYGGDSLYRLCQEVVLGIGGVRMLRSLGYRDIGRFHMNEGHSSLLVLELLDEQARAASRGSVTHEDVEQIRRQCIFTTHTSVESGHDKFPLEMVDAVINRSELYSMKEIFCCEGLLNMTFLGFNLSHFINGVAKRHGEISHQIFPRYPIESITNGVHAHTWTAAPFQELFDQFIPGWREDNFSLRSALKIPTRLIWKAHQQAKLALIKTLRYRGKVGLNEDVFTIGFARRATAYKRAHLLFQDLGRLQAIASEQGSLQLLFAGKAHPQDWAGKEIIQNIFQLNEKLPSEIHLVYLENYDFDLAKLLTSGVDLWLNTPQPPLEASGTSGMKAAFNGVPSLSVLDGWWLEGHIEGITGWAIASENEGDVKKDAHSLYRQLQENILPLFYFQREQYAEIMRHCIALNGSFFNSQRMLQQYIAKAYYQ